MTNDMYMSSATQCWTIKLSASMACLYEVWTPVYVSVLSVDIVVCVYVKCEHQLCVSV